MHESVRLHVSHPHSLELALALAYQFVEPMKAYLGQFPDIKKRVDKRERRQLDHDRCKRAVLTARQKGSKKVRCSEALICTRAVAMARELSEHA